MMPALADRQRQPIHRAWHRSRKPADLSASIFSNFCGGGNPPAMKSVSYSGTSPTAKIRPPSIRHFPPHAPSEKLLMTLTVAHISPIISVIAGVLILIMPRLLNLIVAIFLILNGLIGLGLLRWLHL